jgi:hypothetical protein
VETEVFFLEYIILRLKCSVDYLILYEHTIILNACNNFLFFKEISMHV